MTVAHNLAKTAHRRGEDPPSLRWCVTFGSVVTCDWAGGGRLGRVSRVVSSLIFGSVVIGCGGAPGTRAGNQTQPPPPAASSQGPIALATGEVIEVDPSASTFGAELVAPTGNEKFVLILASTKLSNPDRPIGYSVARRAAARGRASPRDACSVKRSLEPHRAPPEPPPVAVAGAVVPTAGAGRTFVFRAHGGTERVAARAVAVGAASVAWADTTSEHPASLETSFVAEFQSDFERLILPRARAVFGTESDVDGDGRIALLFTPLTSGAGVAFFSGCDLSPKSACDGSNEAELLYLTPPNAIQPPYNTPRAVKEILAHELEHLIHHHRKVLRNHLRADPDAAYMLEGFGALAQDVVGFQAGNLYVTKAGLDEIDDFSFADLLPDGAEYARDRDGALRGGAYLFVRWLYDRAGGDRVGPDGRVEDLGGPSLVRSLLDAPSSVAAELPSRTAAPIADLMMDFFTALALGGVAPSNPCFRYLPTSIDPVTGRQRGADLFASFHGMRMQGPALQDGARADGRLRPGGVEYLVLDAEPGAARLPFTVSVDAGASPRLRVARVR